MTKPQRVNKHPAHKAAWEALSDGRFADLLRCATELQEAFPDHTTPHMLLGEAWAKLGVEDKALELYRKAIELHDTRWSTKCKCASDPHMSLLSYGAAADAAHGMGKILDDRGNSDEALSCYERSFELWPDSERNLHLLAEAYRRCGRLEDAKRVLRWKATKG